MEKIFQKENYEKNHCWQYEMRLQNLEKDLLNSHLTKKETGNLKVSDFEFLFIPKENQWMCQKIKSFIERHEWLGKMPNRPTHRFIATYKDELAGVVVMATPNSFSHLLGEENKNKEKLISRGACISWSPKNLASALIMYSIRWMVQNTEFRYFTAYSDTEARELGTIYQACNFTYLGQKAGGRFEYFDPNHPKRGWFSDRVFRKLGSYKTYAKRLGMKWEPLWSEEEKIFWNRIPMEIQSALKEESKKDQERCKKREIPRKHKYVYILGRSKSETRVLKKKFSEHNPDKLSLSYPKFRGPVKKVAENSAEGPLTKDSRSLRPIGRMLTIKEVAKMYPVSIDTLYELIKNDPTFPYQNVGLKKKYVISQDDYERWLKSRSLKERKLEGRIPSIEELMEVAV